MQIEALQQQQLALLARKALLKDELEAIDRQLARIAAIGEGMQLAAPAPQPEDATEAEAPTEA